MFRRLKEFAQLMRREAIALYLAARDPRTPWYAKAFAGVVVAYTFSPIDLIPDFIPVLGHLDDLILTPITLWLAVRLIPPHIIKDCREQAEDIAERPVNKTAALIVVVIWLGTAAVASWALYSWMGREAP